MIWHRPHLQPETPLSLVPPAHREHVHTGNRGTGGMEWAGSAPHRLGDMFVPRGSRVQCVWGEASASIKGRLCECTGSANKIYQLPED